MNKTKTVVVCTASGFSGPVGFANVRSASCEFHGEVRRTGRKWVARDSTGWDERTEIELGACAAVLEVYVRNSGRTKTLHLGTDEDASRELARILGLTVPGCSWCRTGEVLPDEDTCSRCTAS